jgi:uncharacterized protein YdeI (YjbR/CyaY-like superfamily)
LPTISFADRAAWQRWLSKHHATSRGLWLKFAKKGAPATSISYAQALDVALAWGWIDGQKRALDASFWRQRFTRRGPRSIWSRINRDKAIAMISSGEMQPAGLAEVERAQRDGRWDAAYESQSRATIPLDLAAALSAHPRAAEFFATLSAQNRYAILFRLHTAKRAETRVARIEKFVAMLERGETLHP